MLPGKSGFGDMPVRHPITSMEIPASTSALRVGVSSSTFFEGIKSRKDFGAVENNDLCFRVSWRGQVGVGVRGPWDGSSAKERVVRVTKSRGHEQSDEKEEQLKYCVRCGKTYRDEDNSPVACKYHGHMTGDRGLYAFAPPHQGIDGEWTDASGVIVYKWNNEGERPSTGSENWKRRWTCCGVHAEDAVPCQAGRHVSYDDGATRF